MRYGDPAGCCNALQARGDIDAIAVNIISFNDHVAEVNANAKLNAAIPWHIRISLLHSMLPLHRARHRAHDTWEFHQHAVASQLHDPSLMLGDFALDKISSNRL